MSQNVEFDSSPLEEGIVHMEIDSLVFWNSEGKIVPSLLYEFFTSMGIGNYFFDNAKKKNSEPVIVKISGNIVTQVNVGYLLQITKNHILKVKPDYNDAGPVLDSLHSRTSLFSERNLKLLKTFDLKFLTDTPEAGYFVFQNGIVQVTSEGIEMKSFDDFDDFIWEQSIIPRNFLFVNEEELQNSDFTIFLKDLTRVEDSEHSLSRFISLSSAIGYLLHRFKDPATTKAVILMDMFVNGQPNGGSGKTLLIISIGKLRILSVLDGKNYDQREWFSLSSVNLESEILLFDDVDRNFDFEQIFPMMTTGMQVRRKYQNNLWLPFERAPKIVITTNYAIDGDSDSHRRRKLEFEVSPTYSASFTPRDKFGRNFFSDWGDADWNRFYNTMLRCLQVFLKNGLVVSVPVNLNYTKVINKTSEEFVEWSENHITGGVQYDKRLLYDNFLTAYPEYASKLKQRDFTFWLRAWAEYRGFELTEGHSGDVRYIKFGV